MTSARLEFLVEPFNEGAPGPHVTGVTGAFEQAGFDVEMGAFANIVVGDLDDAIGVLAEALRAGFAAGASQIRFSVERS